MCEKCGQLEYAAEMSTEKWLEQVRQNDEMATALAEAQFKLAKVEASMAQIAVLALRAEGVAGYPVRGLIEQILVCAGGDSSVAKAG